MLLFGLIEKTAAIAAVAGDREQAHTTLRTSAPRAKLLRPAVLSSRLSPAQFDSTHAVQTCSLASCKGT